MYAHTFNSDEHIIIYAHAYRIFAWHGHNDIIIVIYYSRFVLD